MEKRVEYHLVFYVIGSMYRQSWVDIFINYNTPLPSPAAVERYFPWVLQFLQRNELA